MSDIDLGPPVLVWRDDPLFNQGHIAAELALGALRGVLEDDSTLEDVEHAIERLEAFLEAARVEAAARAIEAQRAETENTGSVGDESAVA